MKQYDFYDGLPPHVDSDTSLEAAIEILESASTLRAQLYRWLAACGPEGATDDEAEVASGLTHQCVSARRRELVLAGVVVDSGRRRLTRSGRRAAVWVVRRG